jgi:hypothetical protein
MSQTAVSDVSDVTVTVTVKNSPQKKLKLRIILDNLKQKPSAEEEKKNNPSVWMRPMHRKPKAKKPLSILWETEEITDDEAEDVAELNRRDQFANNYRDNYRHIMYQNRLDDLQDAGLFLNW